MLVSGVQDSVLASDEVEDFHQKYGPRYRDEERMSSWSYAG